MDVLENSTTEKLLTTKEAASYWAITQGRIRPLLLERSHCRSISYDKNRKNFQKLLDLNSPIAIILVTWVAAWRQTTTEPRWAKESQVADPGPTGVFAYPPITEIANLEAANRARLPAY
jgi:hypothetical protein